MPGRLLLPKNDIGTPNYQIGEWKDFSIDFPELYKKIEKPETIKENITSIPSPWARLLLFRDALNPGHKLHQKLTSELLDVLEIIFFKNSIIFEVVVGEIDLNCVGTLSNFNSTIRDLNPEKSNFKLIKLLYLQEKGIEQPILLAGSSPYSLFFTPEDKHPKYKRYFQSVRNFSERPEYFRKYIKRLCASVSDKVVNDNKQLIALNDFLSSLVRNEPNTTIRFKNGDKDIIDHCETFTPISGIDILSFKYDHIDSTLKIKSTKYKDTPPLVIINNYHGPYYNNYLFSDEIKDLTVFNDREVLPGEMIKYPWIYPEIDFLEDHIIKVPYETNDDILVLGHPGAIEHRRTTKYLMPIKNRFFEFFDPIDIDKYLTIEENLNRVELTLKIPIQNNNYVTIKKSFFGVEQIIETKFDDVPYLCIWPKISPEEWKDHYFMIEYLPSKTSGIEFFNKDGEGININSSDSFDKFYKQIVYKRGKSEQNNIYSSAYLPDMIQLKINKNEKSFKGMFLIDKKNFGSVNYDDTKKAVISFDFGTSNTTIAYQISGLGEITSLFESKNELQKLFNYSEFAYVFSYPEKLNSHLEFFLKSLQVYFFPQYFSYIADSGNNEAVVPFSSIISFDKAVNKNVVMLRANIPFYLTWASEEFGLLGDLKWQTGDQARELTQIYIEQLLLMVKYFLLKNRIRENNVKLIWSYPRSFSKSQVDQLKATWNNILQNSEYKIKSIDESKASLIYFIREDTLAPYRDSLKITCDIGGGTSDISVHIANKNILSSSTLLGGNDLIGESDLDSPLYLFLLNKAKKDSGNNLFIESNFYDKAEYIKIPTIRLKFNYIIKKEFRDDKLNSLLSGQDFNFGKFILLYFYSALFFEIGLKLKKIDNSLYPEVFFFGGNGAKFLNWLNYGDWSEESSYVAFFNDIFKIVLGVSNNLSFKIRLSPKPKSEVAIGACHSINDTTLIENFEGENSQIVAENIILNGKIIKWDEVLNVLLPDPTNPVNFTNVEISSLENSNIYTFNKSFFEHIRSSHYIEFNNDPIIMASIDKIQTDLLSKKSIDQFLRDNVQSLYSSTQDVKVSLFVLGVKGCLNHMMKIIRGKM